MAMVRNAAEHIAHVLRESTLTTCVYLPLHLSPFRVLPLRLHVCDAFVARHRERRGGTDVLGGTRSMRDVIERLL